MRLLLFFLLTGSVLAHPGDHAFLRIQVQGREVRTEMDLPAQVLAPLDKNGDFLIEASELAGGERFLASRIQLSSQGLAVTPSLELLPAPDWQRSDNLIERGNAFVLLKLTYRWPYVVRELSLRFDLFAVASEPDCSVRVDGLGPRQRVKLKPASPHARFGASNRWPLLLLGAADLTALACLAGLSTASLGRSGFLVGYLGLLAALLTHPTTPWAGLKPLSLLLLVLLLARLGLSRPRLPVWLLAAASGAVLAAHRVAGWQLVDGQAAGWFLGGAFAAFLLAFLVGRLAGRRQPLLANAFLLAALLIVLSS